MANFCEKFHVSPEYYKFKMTIPQIALMSLDASRIQYKNSHSNLNNKDGVSGISSGKGSKLAGNKVVQKISNVSDMLGVLSKRK